MIRNWSIVLLLLFPLLLIDELIPFEGHLDEDEPDEQGRWRERWKEGGGDRGRYTYPYLSIVITNCRMRNQLWNTHLKLEEFCSCQLPFSIWTEEVSEIRKRLVNAVAFLLVNYKHKINTVEIPLENGIGRFLEARGSLCNGMTITMFLSYHRLRHHQFLKNDQLLEQMMNKNKMGKFNNFCCRLFIDSLERKAWVKSSSIQTCTRLNSLTSSAPSPLISKIWNATSKSLGDAQMRLFDQSSIYVKCSFKENYCEKTHY